MRRYQSNDPADESRDRRVQDRDQATDQIEPHRQPARLPDVVPIESDKTGRRRCGRLRAGWVEQSFEATQHQTWVNRARRFVNPRRVGSGLPEAVAAAPPSPRPARGQLTAVATRLSPASSRHTADPSAPWSWDDG